MSPPKLTKFNVMTLADKAAGGIAPKPVYILAIRGYRRDTMGVPGRNDVGIYDDAMFLVSPTEFKAVNANTDPSRLGWNPGVGKPYAMLDTGIWYFIKGPHKGRSPALRQATLEEAKKFGVPDFGYFKVTRSAVGNKPAYKEVGYFAINIHSGGDSTTSSWGCQTIPPNDFLSFMDLVWKQMTKYNQQTIPYILINGPV